MIGRIMQEGSSIQQTRFVREIRFAGALDDDFIERWWRINAGVVVGVGVSGSSGSGPVETGYKGGDRGHSSTLYSR